MARRSQGGIVNRLPSSDILGQDRVEHLDGDQDRVRDRRGLRLSLREVVAGAVLAQQIAGRRIWRTGRGQKRNSKIQESRGMIRFGKKICVHTIDTLSYSLQVLWSVLASTFTHSEPITHLGPLSSGLCSCPVCFRLLPIRQRNGDWCGWRPRSNEDTRSPAVYS